MMWYVYRLPSNAVFVYTSDTSYRIFVPKTTHNAAVKQLNADTPLSQPVKVNLTTPT